MGRGGSAALWARGCLLLSWKDTEGEGGCERLISPVGEMRDDGGWMVKTSSDEHQLAEHLAVLTPLAS